MTVDKSSSNQKNEKNPGWVGADLMHGLNPEMHYFVCVLVSVPVTSWKLGGMEEMLNGAEPDSAVSAWISRELC